jgi:integrase
MKWLDVYENENTKGLYAETAKVFLRCMGKTEAEYLSEKRDYESDVITFFTYIKDKAPLTVKAYLHAIKAFFEYNNINVDPKIFKQLAAHKRGGAQTMDRAPNKEELKHIIENVKLEYKALFLLLSSSGLRISEALALTWSDLSTEEQSATVRKTKSGSPRVVFFSVEALEYLQQLTRTDGLIFSCSDEKARFAFAQAQKALGIYEKDKNTGRSVLHLHSLRKYFFSRMSVINREMTEALMGHEGYLTGSYRRFSSEDLMQFYQENEGALWIFERSEQSARDKDRISQHFNPL